MTAKKIRRDMALITTELQTALLRQTTDIIAIGGLLIEAQEQLAHGVAAMAQGKFRFDRTDG